MNKLIFLLPLVLTACATTVAKKDFPDAPKQLLQPCPELKQVDTKETKLSGMLDVVIENYSNYQECSVKVDSWIDWYNTQKKIDDSVK